AYSEPILSILNIVFVTCVELKSSQLRHTGHCNWRSWNRSPFIFRRSQVLFGIHRLFPGNHPTSVCRHTAHDREQSALRHVLTVIDGFAIANTREKLVMLSLVNVILRTAVPPLFVSCDRESAFRNFGCAFGTSYITRHIIVAT